MSNPEERPGAYVLFFVPDGPLLTYSRDGVLRIDDLNPQKNLTFRMSRGELVRLGIRAIWIAFRSAVAGGLQQRTKR
jgi:hypothetical protein